MYIQFPAERRFVVAADRFGPISESLAESWRLAAFGQKRPLEGSLGVPGKLTNAISIARCLLTEPRQEAKQELANQQAEKVSHAEPGLHSGTPGEEARRDEARQGHLFKPIRMCERNIKEYVGFEDRQDGKGKEHPEKPFSDTEEVRLPIRVGGNCEGQKEFSRGKQAARNGHQQVEIELVPSSDRVQIP